MAIIFDNKQMFSFEDREFLHLNLVTHFMKRYRIPRLQSKLRIQQLIQRMVDGTLNPKQLRHNLHNRDAFMSNQRF
ncbi:hypothetical protein D3C73_1025150 [compost metagenome]